MQILNVESISKSFKDKKLVDNVSLKIDSGTIVGLVGKNGAGKTSIMKCLTALYDIDSGSIDICTYDMKKNRKDALSHVGASIETNSFYDFLSGYENMEILSDGKISLKNIGNVLEYVGLKNSILKPVSTYSLGMKARLSIAVALINNPELIILDEPMNGLDPSGIIELRDMLLSLKEEGKAIIVSSHILSEIEKLCDEIYFVNEGKLVRKVDLRDNNVDLEKIYKEVEKENDEKRYLC